MTIKPSTRASLELVLGFLVTASVIALAVYGLYLALGSFFAFWGMI